jgi:hypothetical protein
MNSEKIQQIENALYQVAYDVYCFEWIEPENRSAHIIERMKLNPSRLGVYNDDRMFQNSLIWLNLFSTHFNLTKKQKDFAIHCAFNKFPMNCLDDQTYTPVSDPLYTGHAKGVNTEFDFTDIIFNALERWDIIYALELYAKDEKAGTAWFNAQSIPIQHAYQIINNDQFGKRYQQLQKKCKKIPQHYCENKEYECINNTGRVNLSAYSVNVLTTAYDIQNGQYDISTCGLVNLLGPEQSHYSNSHNSLLYDSLQKQLNNIKNKQDLTKFLQLIHELGWCNTMFHVTHCFYKDDKTKMLQLLGVDDRETDIKNFDLNNSKDIERCEDLFPLVLKYPYLFNDWYPKRDKSYLYNDRCSPLFVPNHENYLARRHNIER